MRAVTTPEMTVDLGPLDGPVLVFGGPYGNLPATEAVLEEAGRRRIPPTRVLCTGDLVAYGADPAATVALIRASGVRVVMGNCEEALAFDKSDCGCGFQDGGDCDRWSRQWFAHARWNLDDDARAWMGRLPRQLRFSLAGWRFAVIHGGATDISRFIFASTPARDVMTEVAALDRHGRVDGVIGGHCGLPFSRLVDGRLWHNAGVVGLPANDGTPRVWFSVLTPGDGAIEVAAVPLHYDHAAAARRMAQAGMPGPYARAVIDGLWPAIEILPEAEQQARGQPLSPSVMRWPTPRRHAA
jgi:predicted phosphodiesterase